MININFNSNICASGSSLKKESSKTNLKLNAQLNKDTVCFGSKMDEHTPNSRFFIDTKYKTVLDKPLVSNPRPGFERDLKSQNLSSFHAAKTRISSLSRYLKEDMVGFIVPTYVNKGKNKGGYQWFERGAEYLLRGCKEGAKEKDFEPIAKELYGLLALHDLYWKSPEFVDYLSTLEQSPAIEATISAVKSLNRGRNQTFTGKHGNTFSPLKRIDKLLNDGCAYSGREFGTNGTESSASVDHIVPQSWGGPSDDANYLLTTKSANSKRKNKNLIQYLKGG